MTRKDTYSLFLQLFIENPQSIKHEIIKAVDKVHDDFDTKERHYKLLLERYESDVLKKLETGCDFVEAKAKNE